MTRKNDPAPHAGPQSDIPLGAGAAPRSPVMTAGSAAAAFDGWRVHNVERDGRVCFVHKDGRVRYENVAALAARCAALEAERTRLAEALRECLGFVRGWSGVIRRQYGHHSPQSATVDAAIHAARAALAKGGVA